MFFSKPSGAQKSTKTIKHVKPYYQEHLLLFCFISPQSVDFSLSQAYIKFVVLQSALFVEHPKVNISHVGATYTNCPPLSSETKARTAEVESRETEQQASDRLGRGRQLAE